MKEQINNDTSLALKDGRIVHVSEVRRGLDCNAYCANPDCNSRMVAKKGTKKAHHFAHYEKSDCVGSYESALHILAKEILEEEKCIKLKAYAEDIDAYGVCELLPEDNFEAEKVIIEASQGKYRIDALLKNHKEDLVVEILVTHATEEEKIVYLKEHNISAIEIDLSGLIDKNYTRDEIKEIIINDISKQTWLSVKDSDDLIKMKIKELEEKKKLENEKKIEVEKALMLQLGKEKKLEEVKKMEREKKRQENIENFKSNIKPKTKKQKATDTVITVGLIALAIKFRKHIFKLLR